MWYLVWVCGRVSVCFVVGRATRWVQKSGINLSRLRFSTGGSSRNTPAVNLSRLSESTGGSNKSSFSTGSAGQNSQWKKLKTSKKPLEFVDCIRKPDFVLVENGRLRLTNSTVYKNGRRRLGCCLLLLNFLLAVLTQRKIHSIYRDCQGAGGPLTLRVTPRHWQKTIT